VASLWKVDDAATAEWMRAFYEALVVRKLPTAEAVRVAQSEIRSRPKWSHPFFWAGFTYFGL
jgi:CHAT domain-containing protein